MPNFNDMLSKAKEMQEQAVYGLTEIFRADKSIANSDRVAKFVNKARKIIKNIFFII